MILAGHARYQAALLAGVAHFPVIRLTRLSAMDKRALALADNKIAELSEWDVDILSEELNALYDPGIELDFDPTIIGFPTVEVDQYIGNRTKPHPDPVDDIQTFSTSDVAISQRGDLWVCGSHKIICGDALVESTYTDVLGGDRADITFTDPPYNVPNVGHVSGRTGVREFEMARGEMSPAQFTAFLATNCKLIAEFSVPGAVVYICMDWRHLTELQTATTSTFGPPRNLIVWVKTNAGMGSFYRSQHEMILVSALPGAKPTNNFELGGKGRYRTNVWTYPGCNSFGSERDAALNMHPTVKPVALVADALRDCSNRADVVLDPFGGSGTTMIAAERTGRRARLIEIDPIYTDVAVRRWQRLTGKSATLAGTNQTFDQVTLDRQNSHASRHGS